ncbi:MAG TPA: hypothetical protein PK467_15895 [Candidatus Wallbacteria bacterium]|nr:hypothetical protein [Candidatus Wallbacteria bacterium]
MIKNNEAEVDVNTKGGKKNDITVNNTQNKVDIDAKNGRKNSTEVTGSEKGFELKDVDKNVKSDIDLLKIKEKKNGDVVVSLTNKGKKELKKNGGDLDIDMTQVAAKVLGGGGGGALAGGVLLKMQGVKGVDVNIFESKDGADALDLTIKGGKKNIVNVDNDQGDMNLNVKGGKKNVINVENESGDMNLNIKNGRKNILNVDNQDGNLAINTKGGRKNDINAQNQGGDINISTKGGRKNDIDVIDVKLNKPPARPADQAVNRPIAPVNPPAAEPPAPVQPAANPPAEPAFPVTDKPLPPPNEEPAINPPSERPEPADYPSTDNYSEYAKWHREGTEAVNTPPAAGESAEAELNKGAVSQPNGSAGATSNAAAEIAQDTRKQSDPVLEKDIDVTTERAPNELKTPFKTSAE